MSSAPRSVSLSQRLAAATLACGFAFGLSACSDQSIFAGQDTARPSSQQRDPNRIYANHDKGLDPNLTMGDVDSVEQNRKNYQIYREWGVKQTPDWLEICNQVNVPALRKVGFDPQKDLLNRGGSVHKFSCYWSHNSGQIQLLFARMDSLKEANSREGFEPQGTIERDGHTYYMGHIEYMGEGTSFLGYSCSLNYERNGVTYAAGYNGKDKKSHEQACNELISMVSTEPVE